MPITASKENCFRTGANIPYTLTFMNPLISAKNYKRYVDNYYVTLIPVSSSEFVAIVTKSTQNGYCEIEQRNRFKIGDELEILSPSENFLKKIKIEELFDEKGEKVEDALKVQQKLKLKTNLNLHEKDILRRAK